MGVVNLFESGDNEVSDEFYSRSQEKKEKVPTKLVGARVHPTLNEKLNKCAVDHGISKAEVIRMSLDMMMEAVMHPDWDKWSGDADEQ